MCQNKRRQIALNNYGLFKDTNKMNKNIREEMSKIIVIGSPGAGKSIFSQKLKHFKIIKIV